MIPKVDCLVLHELSSPSCSAEWTALDQDPLCGHIFVFRGRRGDLVKLLWYDDGGLCLLARRLDRGRFIWPKAESGTVSLTRAQLSMLCEGIDWRRVERTAERMMAI